MFPRSIHWKNLEKRRNPLTMGNLGSQIVILKCHYFKKGGELLGAVGRPRNIKIRRHTRCQENYQGPFELQ